MKYKTGDVIEALVVRQAHYLLPVVFPDQTKHHLHVSNVDLGPTGLPEKGDLILVMVLDIKADGTLSIGARADQLKNHQGPVLRYPTDSINATKVQITRSPNTNWTIGELILVKVIVSNFFFITVKLPEGSKITLDARNFDKGKLAYPSAGDELPVVVLSIRNNGKPYLGARKDQLEQFGHPSSPQE